MADDTIPTPAEAMAELVAKSLQYLINAAEFPAIMNPQAEGATLTLTDPLARRAFRLTVVETTFEEQAR